MRNMRIFTEIGFGNASFINTEIEIGDRERRVRGCVRMHVQGVYLRVWIGRRVWILSTRQGYKTMMKNRSTFKLLLGFEGVPHRDKTLP